MKFLSLEPFLVKNLGLKFSSFCCHGKICWFRTPGHQLWRPGHDYRDGAKAEVPNGYERLRGKRGAALAEELARRLKSSPYSLLKFVP